MIYCDNAATTWPKPPEVYDRVNRFMTDIGASPGRSSHSRAVEASRMVFATREKCADLFNIADSSRIVFTANATEGLNCAMQGLLNPGDTVLTTSMEHNSVMRPLRYLQNNRGITVIVVDSLPDGRIDVDAWTGALKRGATLAVINHGSNVTGTIVPLDRIGPIARSQGVTLLVDVAQTAGAWPIDVESTGIDLLAFSGHKSLFGPQGTGGLFIRNGIDLRPQYYGGTGSRSDSDEQPVFMPDRFESGTRNGPGIAGLGAGIDFVQKTGITRIQEHAEEMIRELRGALLSQPRITLYGPADSIDILPTLSLTIDGMDNATVARRLDDEFGIATRMGLHCAPNAHRTIGTFPEGTIRISPGWYTAEEDILAIIRACETICRS